MKLKRLRLRNFRCYQSETSIDFDDITALIGRNDSGKSTVMEALDLFLNDNNPDSDDASRGGERRNHFFPMSGSNLACWSSRLEPLNHREFHLCDRDVAPTTPPKYQAHIDAVNARPTCRARSTLKKEMENYLHRDSIIAAYQQNGINVPIAGNFGPFDDVAQQVARLVHEASGGGLPWGQLPDDKREEKERRAKHILCSIATRHMNTALLNQIDPEGDLLQWFNDISDLLA
ncbi:MAG: ATP-binding protein [Acidobacteriia bacterium]|nr:ATP-binding protein [Terriglobia bacterium]